MGNVVVVSGPRGDWGFATRLLVVVVGGDDAGIGVMMMMMMMMVSSLVQGAGHA